MVGVREWYVELPSTQDRALALARHGAEEGTRVVALRQRAGRGRYGHGWESPEGGLYLSMVLAAPEGPTTLFPIALSAAIASEVGRLSSVPLGVRWPNDLLAVKESSPVQKLGGVIVDEVPSPRLRRALVAGIGINVTTGRSAFPPKVRSRIAVLSELGDTTPTVDEVEAMVVHAALGTASALRREGGAAELRELARRYFWGVGRGAILDGRAVGRIAGLGEEGELLVDDHDVRKAFWTGVLEVETVPEPGGPGHL